MAKDVSSCDIKRLFLAHRRELQTYLTRKVRDAQTAADLTQETFLRFAEQCNADGAGGVMHERSYLYRMAHNLAVDHVRQQQRERLLPCSDEALAEIPFDHPSPEQSAMGHSELELARTVLQELPERTRQVFFLARIKGQTYRAVADQLGISESSVQKHLAKAVKHLMQRLRPR